MAQPLLRPLYQNIHQPRRSAPVLEMGRQLRLGPAGWSRPLRRSRSLLSLAGWLCWNVFVTVVEELICL